MSKEKQATFIIHKIKKNMNYCQVNACLFKRNGF